MFAYSDTFTWSQWCHCSPYVFRLPLCDGINLGKNLVKNTRLCLVFFTRFLPRLIPSHSGSINFETVICKSMNWNEKTLFQDTF